MAISIKHVAKAANVSYSTVSRALSDSPRVNPATKERVRRLAAQMGYMPSAVARSLVTRRTHTIGIVVTTITDLFFAEVIHAIEKTALGYKYNVILTNSGGEPAREAAAVQSLQERRVDAIVLVSASSSREALLLANGLGTPVVSINSARREHVGFAVDTDNEAGGRQATQHLLDLGHRRVGHITGRVDEWDAAERQAGYEQALRAAGLPVEPVWIARGGNRPSEGVEAMQRLLALPDRPTAVFCYNDATAIGAMHAAHMAGLRLPEDLSIIGFDDIDLAPFVEPPLTTVAQPKREMGEKAMYMILDLLAGDKPVQDCLLQSQLMVRGSTRPPASTR